MKTASLLNYSFLSDINLDKLHKITSDVALPARFTVKILNGGLVLGSSLARINFRLPLPALVLFGPVLSTLVSSYSIFTSRNHYLYSITGSIFLLLGPLLPLLTLHHLLQTSHHWAPLVGRAASCQPAGGCGWAGLVGGSGFPRQPLLLLQEDQSKASCLRAGLVWCGVATRCPRKRLCLAPISSRWGPMGSPPGAPLRIIFLLCVSIYSLGVSAVVCSPTFCSSLPAARRGYGLPWVEVTLKGLLLPQTQLALSRFARCWTCLPNRIDQHI
ncbi:Fat storage-inducing transmembrane protein 1 [Merluccius polli]|uniref:Fat storage-inducing transmembrane protein 1 n=1 Tax=Merluccius polli TaxID=89951 RepID=A0AA47MR51_MERPO|nr:Fat storage-inducing transmembrane protein 1 [Merluccius polli]